MQKACTHLDPSAEPSAETTEVVLTGLTVTQRKTWQRNQKSNHFLNKQRTENWIHLSCSNFFEGIQEKCLSFNKISFQVLQRWIFV